MYLFQALSEQEDGMIKSFSDDPLPLRISAFFLENVELTRQPLSNQFWDLYSETITRLEFTDSAVLPRVRVETRGADGNPVNFDTVGIFIKPGSLVYKRINITIVVCLQNFNLGCPNLKKLALRKMDKSFMLGGDYLEFHRILCLSNLISLDVSDNKYKYSFVCLSLKLFLCILSDCIRNTGTLRIEYCLICCWRLKNLKDWI